MRKVDNSTSQDGADTSSITSAIENEVKKASGLKTKRTSIKRKMPNFSHESDDTVIEPLLQSEKEKTDISKSAKFLMSKSKTDSGSERSDNVFIETKIEKCSPTSMTPLSETIPYTSKIKEAPVSKVTAPIHNHMNTNVFGGIDVTRAVPAKSAVIVEIEKSRGSTYTPGPLIFTTAKIHTDNKTKQMEPVQMTPVPILSTVEGSVVKSVPAVIDSGESRHELMKPKNEVQKIELQENLQKPIKPIISTSVTNSADSRHDLLNSNSEIQRKEPQENVQKLTKPVLSTKATLNLDTQVNLKTIVTSGKDKIITSSTSSASSTIVAPKQSQSLIDKSSLPKDSIIPTTVSKVDILSKTSTSTSDTKILKQNDMHGIIADKSKKTVADKTFSGFSSFEPTPEKSTKIGNGKTLVLSGDSQKLSPTGVSLVKSEVPSTKDCVVTTSGSSDSKSKEKSISAVSSLTTNKQLQRQKKTTVEDISEADSNTKHVDRGKVDSIGLKDLKGSKVSASVITAPESKTKSSVLGQSIPKTTVDTRSIVTTTSGKPITAIAEKSRLVTSVPTTLSNITSSAKTSLTASKIVSEKDHAKDVHKAVGELSKSANAIKSVKKESIPDVKKGIGNQTVSSQSAKLQETVESAKMPSASKSDSRVTSQATDFQKSISPSVASCVSPTAGSTGKKTGSISQAVSAGKSSTTSSGKSTVTTTLPSSTSSAKALITSNKKIDPISNERNKDSRA